MFLYPQREKNSCCAHSETIYWAEIAYPQNFTPKTLIFCNAPLSGQLYMLVRKHGIFQIQQWTAKQYTCMGIGDKHQYL